MRRATRLTATEAKSDAREWQIVLGDMRPVERESGGGQAAPRDCSNFEKHDAGNDDGVNKNQHDER